MDFQSTHKLDFECAPYELAIMEDDPTMRFRIGTCEGLWISTEKTFDILAVTNSQKGNGHLEDVFDWFENSCKRDNKSLRVLEVWNQKFKRHLLAKRGFRLVPKSDHVIKTKFTTTK